VAEKSDQPLTVNTPDAGAAFRVEMFMQNVVLGYWWVVAIAIGIVLASVAVYGFWDSSRTSAQRSVSAETAAVVDRIEAQLIDSERLDEFAKTRGLRFVVVPSWDDMHPDRPIRYDVALETALAEFGKEGVERESILTEGADELLAIHARSSGPAAAHAALLAAELYRLAGNEESRVRALEAARDADNVPVRFGADVNLAQRAASAGDLATADAQLRPWIVKDRGFFGQQAALELGGMYEAADRAGDAQAIYAELRQIWPASPLLDQVDERLEAMGVAAPGEGSAPPTDDGLDDAGNE
jgi:hypothetical protein